MAKLLKAVSSHAVFVATSIVFGVGVALVVIAFDVLIQGARLWLNL